MPRRDPNNYGDINQPCASKKLFRYGSGSNACALGAGRLICEFRSCKRRRGSAAAIVLTALAFLVCGLRAEEKAGSAGISAPLLPGIGSHDPRIRVDPEGIPWRAIGKLQVVSMNLRAECTATLVGPSTVVTAAHGVFNRRTQRYFPPESLHFLIGYNGSRSAGHAIGMGVKIGHGYDPVRPKRRSVATGR